MLREALYNGLVAGLVALVCVLGEVIYSKIRKLKGTEAAPVEPVSDSAPQSAPDEAENVPAAFCHRCGCRSEQGAVFCHKCGTRLYTGEEA